MNRIEPDLISLWGKAVNRDYLVGVYRWLCQYMYANPTLLSNLVREQKDKSHIGRCVTILCLTGYHMLIFTNNNLLDITNPEIGIKDNISKILHKLSEEQFNKIFSV